MEIQNCTRRLKRINVVLYNVYSATTIVFLFYEDASWILAGVMAGSVSNRQEWSLETWLQSSAVLGADEYLLESPNSIVYKIRHLCNKEAVTQNTSIDLAFLSGWQQDSLAYPRGLSQSEKVLTDWIVLWDVCVLCLEQKQLMVVFQNWWQLTKHSIIDTHAPIDQAFLSGWQHGSLAYPGGLSHSESSSHISIVHLCVCLEGAQLMIAFRNMVTHVITWWQRATWLGCTEGSHKNNCSFSLSLALIRNAADCPICCHQENMNEFWLGRCLDFKGWNISDERDIFCKHP